MASICYVDSNQGGAISEKQELFNGATAGGQAHWQLAAASPTHASPDMQGQRYW